MQERRVDVAIIGGGTAGLAAWRAAHAQGQDAVIIEGGPFGTTCARVGCMPSKLLIAAAEAAHRIEHSHIFGIHSQGLEINGREVMTRVRSERDRFVGFVLESVASIPEQAKILGYARFINDHQLQVGDELLITAKRIVIATGSSPAIPGPLRAAGERLIINDDLFAWQDLPRSVAVFGAGVIGLELGQALHRLGVEVKMFSLGGGIGAISDPDILSQAKQLFADEFYLDLDAQTKVTAGQDSVLVDYLDPASGEWQQQAFDYLLAATGRKANVDSLGLENTSLALDERGVPLFDRQTMRCGQSHIFMAGDVNNDRPLLHEAADEGKIAGDNAASYPLVSAGLRKTAMSVVFSDPQIALAGLSFRQVEAQYPNCYALGEVDFSGQGRSRVMAVNKGKLRLYGRHGDGLLLGAEMIGPAAEHLVHLLAWAIQRQQTVSQLLDMPFYHPVIEEGLRTALRDLHAQLKMGPELVGCLECGPGS